MAGIRCGFLCLPAMIGSRKLATRQPPQSENRPMIKTLDRASITFVTVGRLVIALSTSPARAQSATLVLCDRIAAEPSDPDRPADIKGVSEIAPGDVATAIKFCRIAAASSRRAMYELG